MKKISILLTVISLIAASISSCSKKEETAAIGSYFNTTPLIGDLSKTVKTDTTFTVDYTFGQATIPSMLIRKAVTDSADIFLSLSVASPIDNPLINDCLGRYVTETYNFVADKKIVPSASTEYPENIAALCDMLADNFSSEIIPEYSLMETPAFNITIAIEPQFADNEKEISTYAFFHYYYTGGAHGTSDLSFTTFKRGRQLKVEDIIKPEDMSVVREIIANTIAQAKGMDTDIYLTWLNDFLMTDESTAITTANFPIYSMGIVNEGVVVSYPVYSIGPASDGNPSYLLPTDIIAPYLAF